MQGFQDAEDLDGHGFGQGRSFFQGDEPSDLLGTPEHDILGLKKDPPLLPERRTPPRRVGFLSSGDSPAAVLGGGERHFTQELKGGGILDLNPFLGFKAFIGDQEPAIKSRHLARTSP